MTEIKQNNFSAMTVDAVIEQLAGAYTAVLRQGLPLKLLPSVMLWGPPGVGKSQAVRQLADRIRRETGKQTVVTDVRLLLFNPIDLRGIPTANEDKTLAVWLKPKIFQMDPSPNVVNLLFLDELSAAPQSVQAAAYQITLDRVVGEHKLPENCIVLAAGNLQCIIQSLAVARRIHKVREHEGRASLLVDIREETYRLRQTCTR